MFYSFSILLVKRTDRLIFGRQISNTRGGESFFFALTRCFWSDRAFIISALNKKIWFQKYFTENVLKPLLKQAYYLRVLHSKVRSLKCNPYLFLRLNDFRSYSHPSGPEYVFTIFVIHKLFLLKNYSTFLCAQLHSPEKRKEKRF